MKGDDDEDGGDNDEEEIDEIRKESAACYEP